MRYLDFENIMSSTRIARYLSSCGGNSMKAMTLYRRNLKLSQELFTVLSCFEIGIRNKIDTFYLNHLGNDWLKNAASRNGVFDNRQCRVTKETINKSITKLNQNYTHNKLVAELGFGFWRYMFAPHQYRVCGQILIQIFPNRPSSTPRLHYNSSYVFQRLEQINKIRNRIAHHEPICFVPQQAVKSSNYTRQHYAMILELFQWMDIDEAALLYGLDHINRVCDDIDAL